MTLITGDKVTVMRGGAAGERFSVQPGAGRGNITFSTHRGSGHLHVVPSDAVELLDDGLLDQRLFDVTTLLDCGYADSRTMQLPLIIAAKRGGTSVGGGTGKARSRAANAGAKVVREIPAVGAVAVRQDRGRAPRVWQNLTIPTTDSANRALRPEIGKIFLDGRRKPVLDTSSTQVGAPTAWKSGYTGNGVTVAVLDTGIDATHPDLAGKVIAQRNFTEGSEAAEDSLDHAGHGTHVASIVAGSGAASGGKYQGVASGAKVLDGKVCRVGGCAESWILAGISWAVTERKAKVVNLSLADVDTEETDPIEQAVATLSETHGTLFVVSAGNDGGDASISTPGSAPAALTVGSVGDSDALADHSNRGPSLTFQGS